MIVFLFKNLTGLQPLIILARKRGPVGVEDINNAF